jgi:alkylation response protein AidB-like acyl-CoA dehydrogenase
MGKGYTGVLWGLGGGNSIGVPPIVNFGTQAQKDRFLPGVANGSITFCLGITEPDGVSLCAVNNHLLTVLSWI